MKKTTLPLLSEIRYVANYMGIIENKGLNCSPSESVYDIIANNLGFDSYTELRPLLKDELHDMNELETFRNEIDKKLSHLHNKGRKLKSSRPIIEREMGAVVWIEEDRDFATEDPCYVICVAGPSSAQFHSFEQEQFLKNYVSYDAKTGRLLASERIFRYPILQWFSKKYLSLKESRFAREYAAGINIGDVFYTSFSLRFFEVVGKSGKTTLKFKELSSVEIDPKMVPEQELSPYHCSIRTKYRRPEIGKFIGIPFSKRVKSKYLLGADKFSTYITIKVNKIEEMLVLYLSGTVINSDSIKNLWAQMQNNNLANLGLYGEADKTKRQEESSFEQNKIKYR